MPEVEQLIETLTRRIQAAAPGLLSDVTPESYISHMDRDGRYQSYHEATPDMEKCCQRIQNRAGKDTLEAYHKLILLMLIRDFEGRARHYRYPDSIRDQYQRQFSRIVAQIEQDQPGPYLYESDSFCKDLGLCRQRLIPCGVQLSAISGIPRRWLLQSTGAQRSHLAWMVMAKLGGFRPLYEPHTDRRQLQEFHREGWRRCYARLAELLRLNPEIRGIFAAGWWHDPGALKISPKLRYLRDDPEAGGAGFFCLGEEESNTENALVHSPQRQRRYDEGTYRPKVYAIVWARKDLIRWVETQGW